MTSSPVSIDTDILVIGGTAAGCSAAIAAAREGSHVVVLEPTQSIGGVSANGVHCFDVGSRQALSGTAEEFTRRVLRHYERIGLDDPMLKSRVDVFWEFHVADRIWRSMLAEHDRITFINGAVPIGVVVNGSRIEAGPLGAGGRRDREPAIRGRCNAAPGAGQGRDRRELRRRRRGVGRGGLRPGQGGALSSRASCRHHPHRDARAPGEREGIPPGLTHEIAQVAQLELAGLSRLRKRPRSERKRLLSG